MLLLLSLWACSDPGILTQEAVVSEAISTVITVEFETEEPVIARVDFGPDEALGLSTSPGAEPTTTHRFTLLRPADAETWWQPVVLDGDKERGGDVEVTTTGSLPAELPSFSVEGTHDRWHAVPVIGALSAPLILDPDGEVVWYWLDDRGLDTYRVRIDGDSVVYNAASVSGDPADDSVLVRVALDGSWEEEVPVPLLAHDFVLLPDGGIGAIAVEYRGEGEDEIRGDKLVEVHEGEVTDVWSTWDCFDPETTPGDEHGWTFANALDYDQATDAYMLGMRAQSTIQRIPRSDLSCDWSVGGQAGTIEVTEGRPFLHQHQFELLDDDHLLVFDNDGTSGTSRAVEYALDLQAGTAEQVWEYVPSPNIYTFVLGDVARLPDGDTLITWSVAGQIDRVSAEGEVEWTLNAGMGFALGFDTIYDQVP